MTPKATGANRADAATHAPGSDALQARLRAIEADIAAGRLQQAAAALNAVVAAAPGDARIYLSGAMLAHAAGNPQQELAALKHAVQLAPNWWPAFAELAKALVRQERLGEAVAVANKAVELAPRELVALEVAVAVANSAGDPASARRHLTAALALRPGDPGIRRALGVVLDKLHEHAAAETLWRGILAEHPDDVSALGWLGICLIALGRKDDARAPLQRALELDPGNPNLAFQLALARGETPPTQPLGSIQQLFDDYANRFDLHLQSKLGYQVPQRVAQIIRVRHPALDIGVLDLGCGTGLLGAHLGAIRGAFVGVDLSRNMLEKAKRLNVYSRLRLNDLVAELAEIDAATFDYAVANDVFIYLGDLGAAIPAAFRVLKPGGALIFSCETAGEDEGALVLRPSRRYAHSRASVERLCRAAGFRSCAIEDIELRLDAAIGVIPGFIAIAQK